MPIFHELPAAEGGVPVKVWTANLEASAAAQLRALAGSGLLVGHVAAMPDAHAARGATVGAVFATRDLLLPSAIGTDSGCGVLAQPLDVRAGDLPPALLRELQAQIKWTIPLAHGEQGEARAWDGLEDAGRYTSAVTRIVREAGPWQLGTLGGGNHFLELCREAEGEGAACVWLLVHSGSRGVGSASAAHHIGIARTLAPRLGRPSVGDLAPLPLDTQEGQDYLTDLLWAQAYAAENRRQLQQAVLNLLARLVGRKQPANPWSRAAQPPRAPDRATSPPRARLRPDGGVRQRPQLHRMRGALRRTAPGPPQGGGGGPDRRAGDHPRLDGDRFDQCQEVV